MEYKDWGNLKREEEINLERRKFLKNMVVGVLGATASWKALDKAMDLFFEEESEDKSKKKELTDLDDKKKSRQESDENEIEIKKTKREKPEEILNPEEMASEMLRVYNLPAVQKLFDRDVFTKDFFIAQQFQESRGRKEAESEAGAKGVYQNTPGSVKEVIKYMTALRERTKDLSEGERCDYIGQYEISGDEAEKITNLFVEHTNYGRAAGKLYLLAIHDKDSKFNTGDNPDVFRSKSPERQRELLLLAYHDGPGRRYSPEDATQNARKYVRLVKEKMNIIADIRKRLEEAEMSRDLDYAILKILRKLDDAENKGRANEAIFYWLKKLQERHIAKWREDGNFGKPLADNEIEELFESS